MSDRRHDDETSQVLTVLPGSIFIQPTSSYATRSGVPLVRPSSSAAIAQQQRLKPERLPPPDHRMNQCPAMRYIDGQYRRYRGFCPALASEVVR
jgi:hypothetical protein